MPTTVNMHEAKTQLSKLVKQVEAGEEVVIARDGKPVAKLVAVNTRKQRPKFGWGKGKGLIIGDFDAPMTAEELAEWYDAPLTTAPAEPAEKTARKKKGRK